MSGRNYLGIVCGALLLGCGASTAEAQLLGGGGGFGLGFFNYGNTGVYMERIPYYALYPPVYYSYPVARTYGYSPFAYPPGTMTPDLPPQMRAAEYINPFVTPEAQPAGDKMAAGASAGSVARVRVAQTYFNPFVDAAELASVESLTARRGE